MITVAGENERGDPMSAEVAVAVAFAENIATELGSAAWEPSNVIATIRRFKQCEVIDSDFHRTAVMKFGWPRHCWLPFMSGCCLIRMTRSKALVPASNKRSMACREDSQLVLTHGDEISVLSRLLIVPDVAIAAAAAVALHFSIRNAAAVRLHDSTSCLVDT